MSKKAHIRSLAVVAALAVAVFATPHASALERGRFTAGVYTAPGQLFTVKSPLGPAPHVIDSFDRSAGAVTFLDETGALFGVICTPSFDVLAGADNDTETDLAILRNWFRDATFPLFFARQLPGAAVLEQGPATFEGSPAWVAVIHLPHGSAMSRTNPKTGQAERMDSYRGLVVFSRGGNTFLLMTETPPNSEWSTFLPHLTGFYRGMEFDELAPIPVDFELAKALDAN
jgi:hypothetical protein